MTLKNAKSDSPRPSIPQNTGGHDESLEVSPTDGDTISPLAWNLQRPLSLFQIEHISRGPWGDEVSACCMGQTGAGMCSVQSHRRRGEA